MTEALGRDTAGFKRNNLADALIILMAAVKCSMAEPPHASHDREREQVSCHRIHEVMLVGEER